MGIHFRATGTAANGRSASQPSASPSLGQKTSLEPLLAGAQARGMADMLEMLELGAIMVRADGGILLVSERASSLMEGAIVQAAGHLAGNNAGSRAGLDRLLAKMVAGEVCREVIATESKTIELRSCLLPVEATSAAQLLHGVIAVRRLA
jgi:hypothetical protein